MTRKIALVTAASRGIGAATARMLAEEARYTTGAVLPVGGGF